MRPDQQKLNAQQKEGAKTERKDLENRRQLTSPGKRGHHNQESGQGLVRQRDEKGQQGAPR